MIGPFGHRTKLILSRTLWDHFCSRKTIRIGHCTVEQAKNAQERQDSPAWCWLEKTPLYVENTQKKIVFTSLKTRVLNLIAGPVFREETHDTSGIHPQWHCDLVLRAALEVDSRFAPPHLDPSRFAWKGIDRNKGHREENTHTFHHRKLWRKQFSFSWNYIQSRISCHQAPSYFLTKYCGNAQRRGDGSCTALCFVVSQTFLHVVRLPRALPADPRWSVHMEEVMASGKGHHLWEFLGSHHPQPWRCSLTDYRGDSCQGFFAAMPVTSIYLVFKLWYNNLLSDSFLDNFPGQKRSPAPVRKLSASIPSNTVHHGHCTSLVHLERRKWGYQKQSLSGCCSKGVCCGQTKTK